MARELHEIFGIQRVEKTLTIRRDAASLFRAWRNFSVLPTFMANVISVVESGARSQWVVRAAQGNVLWHAVLTDEIPDRLIAWRSLDPMPLSNAAEVWFQDAGHGRATQVRLVLAWEVAPRGAVPGVATICGRNPSRQLEEDLYRFKRLMETGSVPTVLGQPHGTTKKVPNRYEPYVDGAAPFVAHHAVRRLGPGELHQ